MRTIIETKNLTKTYTLGDVDVDVLRGIDIEIKTGDFISILGPSGSGKSTLLNMIGALDAPTLGTVIIDGEDITDMNLNDLANVRSCIGFVFQFFNLIGRLTAFQNVELPLALKKVSKTKRIEQVTEYLELVGLKKRMDHKPSELSGGEQQRVAIARALAQEPKYLLMDEPTGNLDTRTSAQLMKLIQDLNEFERLTTIIITHDSRITEITNKTYFIVDGKLYDDALTAEQAEREQFQVEDKSISLYRRAKKKEEI